MKRSKPDFIRFTQFTPKGDAVITEFQFNGKLIYYRYDSSRDLTEMFKRGRLIKGKFIKGPKIEEDYCKTLVNDPQMPYLSKCYKNKGEKAYEF